MGGGGSNRCGPHPPGPAAQSRFIREQVRRGGHLGTSEEALQHLVGLLGGWPEHFEDDQIRHGLSLLALLRRDRILDEVAFGMVIRYADHRAAYDRLSKDINEDEDFKATASNYMSGLEQSRAYHENRLLTLERELLTTPYSRAKNGQQTQTSFLDLLEEPSPDGDGSGKIMPFKPMARKGRG